MPGAPKFFASVEIGAKVKGAIAGFARVGAGFKSLGRAGLMAGKAVGAAGIAVAGAGAAVGAAMYEIVESSAQANDVLAKQARRSGLSAQAYAELRHAADLAGVSQEEFGKSVEKMTRNMGDLRLGTGSLYTTLKKGSPALLEQLKATKDSGEAFDLLTGAIAKLKSPADKASLATAAFGRAGGKMTLLVQDGAEGLAKARAEFTRLHGVIDDDVLASSEELLDNQARMKLAMGGLKATIGNQLIPVFAPLVANFTEYIAANREVIAQNVGAVFESIATWVSQIDFEALAEDASALFERISITVGALKDFGVWTARVFGDFIDWIDKAIAPLDKLFERLDVFGLMEDSGPLVTGDAAAVAEFQRRKAGAAARPALPAPLGGMSLPPDMQSIGGTVEVKVTTEPGTTARVERVESESRAVPLKASTGRRSTGTGRP